MTQDEIIELARQANAGMLHGGGYSLFGTEKIEAFAKLVADREREACAVIAEEWFCGCGRGNCPEGDRRAHDIADSIRARGEA